MGGFPGHDVMARTPALFHTFNHWQHQPSLLEMQNLELPQTYGVTHNLHCGRIPQDNCHPHSHSPGEGSEKHSSQKSYTYVAYTVHSRVLFSTVPSLVPISKYLVPASAEALGSISDWKSHQEPSTDLSLCVFVVRRAGRERCRSNPCAKGFPANASWSF